jgi:hypothetical protein
MNAAFILALLFQNSDYPAANSSADTQRRESELPRIVSLPYRPPPSAASRDREFVGKFNKLINTLIDFADSYKDGESIDVKKAQAVRKAWGELEKTEAFFQSDKKK